MINNFIFKKLYLTKEREKKMNFQLFVSRYLESSKGCSKGLVFVRVCKIILSKKNDEIRFHFVCDGTSFDNLCMKIS